MAEWVLHFDGLYEPRFRKDGVSTYGFVVRHGDEPAHRERGVVAPPGPNGSANLAEYGALILGLTWLKERGGAGGCPLRVRGDSRLVVETVAGRWKLSSEVLIPLRDLAASLARDLDVATFEKVSREENAEADALSREAYHEAVRAHPEWGLGPKRGSTATRA